MQEYKKRIGIFFREDWQLHVVIRGRRKFDQLAFARRWARHTRATRAASRDAGKKYLLAKSPVSCPWAPS